jgi:hypothetical protein
MPTFNITTTKCLKQLKAMPPFDRKTQLEALVKDHGFYGAIKYLKSPTPRSLQDHDLAIEHCTILENMIPKAIRTLTPLHQLHIGDIVRIGKGTAEIIETNPVRIKFITGGRGTNPLPYGIESLQVIQPSDLWVEKQTTNFEKRLQKAWDTHDNLPSTQAYTQLKELIYTFEKHFKAGPNLRILVIPDCWFPNGGINLRIKVKITPGEFEDLLFTAHIRQTGYPIETQYETGSKDGIPTGVETFCEDHGGLQNWFLDFIRNPKIKIKLRMYKTLAS